MCLKTRKINFSLPLNYFQKNAYAEYYNIFNYISRLIKSTSKNTFVNPITMKSQEKNAFKINADIQFAYRSHDTYIYDYI